MVTRKENFGSLMLADYMQKDEKVGRQNRFMGRDPGRGSDGGDILMLSRKISHF
jgi:hypothetical protein